MQIPDRAAPAPVPAAQQRSAATARGHDLPDPITADAETR